jgi:hypothetical protein
VKAHIGPDRFGSLAGHGSIEMPEQSMTRFDPASCAS